MNEIDWQKVKDQFEREMLEKLRDLPGHREIPEELREFRNIISHELPETAPKILFRKLIKLLLSGEKVDIRKAKKEYLELEIEKEKQILSQYKMEFEGLKQSAKNWVKKNLSEEKLQKMWNDHETWLPRKYGIYSKKVSFQRIVSDTLARFYLINRLSLVEAGSGSKDLPSYLW